MRYLEFGLLLLLGALTSCDSSSDSKSTSDSKLEVERWKVRLDELNADTEDRVAEFVETIDELEDENRDLFQESQGLKSQLSKKDRELEKLSSEFSDYQKTMATTVEGYVARLRVEAVGERVSKHEIGGKVLQDLVVLGIDGRGIRARHKSGVIMLTEETAPKVWVERYLSLGRSSASSTNLPVAKVRDEVLPEEAMEERAPDQEATFDPRKAIVIIEGNAGVGSGFFVKSGGSIYLYTAAHVLSGNQSLKVKTISGREFKKFGRVEIADDVDMARMRVLEKVPFVFTLPKANDIKNETEIHAMGNSGGGAVVTDSKGVVQGVGAESFEISAEVIQGNSGGPIVKLGTTTVLGLVTHGMKGRSDVWAEGTRYADIRRFGARMDRRIKWTSVLLTTFLAEHEKVEQFNKVTRLLYALSMLQPSADGLRLTTIVNGKVSALHIFQENQAMTAVKSLLRMNTELRSKKIKPDVVAIKKRFAAYYRGIVAGSSKQVEGAKSLSPYHRNLIQAGMDERTEAHTAVVKRLRSLSR